MRRPDARNSRPVYSTSRPLARPDAPGARVEQGAVATGARDGVVRLLLDRSGRRGRPVTVVRGLPGSDSCLEAQAAEFRRLCAAGGAVREGDIEIQGDHRERLAGLLRARGHRVALAGG